MRTPVGLREIRARAAEAYHAAASRDRAGEKRRRRSAFAELDALDAAWCGLSAEARQMFHDAAAIYAQEDVDVGTLQPVRA